MDSDPHRFCIYCGTDCIDFPNMEPDHRDDCPQTTGLYPIEARDVSAGIVCVGCSEPFKKGDVYVERLATSNIFEMVCLACGFAALLELT